MADLIVAAGFSDLQFGGPLRIESDLLLVQGEDVPGQGGSHVVGQVRADGDPGQVGHDLRVAGQVNRVVHVAPQGRQVGDAHAVGVSETVGAAEALTYRRE
ncbi:hypothetical protein [Streptomyces sp. NPDC045251]|uniref:hypothetical protein n=1 Tax=unclassified Streptomyces TaxID=2593676 RepID=UPI003400E8EF